jgi:poly-gamma-glutamate synthesis protein (capsule biosynthesis protein)
VIASRSTICVVALIVVLVACAAPPASLQLEKVLDPAIWNLIYLRNGWAGGPTADVRAVGDVMLGRSISARAKVRGLDYPFTAVSATSQSALLKGDLVLGNLEGPLTDRPGPIRPGPYRLPAPTAFAPALRAAGFHGLALANNHALDVGPAGLADASESLRQAGVVAIGVGADGASARIPQALPIGQGKALVMAFNDVADLGDTVDEPTGWGRAWLDDAALTEVRSAAAQADLVIVLVHWGDEYHATPSDRQRSWARRLAEAGADIVIGSHPHVLQPIEQLQINGRTVIIAYSLGNFVFDQESRFETSSGAVLRILVDHVGVALVAVAPIDIQEGRVFPLPPASREGQAVLRALGDPRMVANASEAANPTLRSWRWDGHSAVLAPVPRRARRVAQPDQLLVDLRGDGSPLWATRTVTGAVRITTLDAAGTALWQNEAADWNVQRMVAGDPNRDGRVELLLLLWKPDASGRLRSHPFLVGYRGGRFRVIWGGSPLEPSAQDAAIGDIDGDGADELVLLRGGALPGDSATSLSIWRWDSWIFVNIWEESISAARSLSLQDLDGDGRVEIVVE